MPSPGFEHAVSAIRRFQAYALARKDIGTALHCNRLYGIFLNGITRAYSFCPENT